MAPLEILFWVAVIVLAFLVFAIIRVTLRSEQSSKSAMDLVREGHELNKRQTRLLEEINSELGQIKDLMEKK